jgi:two-component system, NarL family, nitrate/nitrite response regulator NarL
MKLLIVDDHSLLRDGLSALLRQLGPNTIVLNANGGAEALDVAAREPDLDLVILDLAMPDMDGPQVIKALGARRPDLPIVVLSASEDAADVRRVMALGALGYVPKSANPQTLLSALQLVLAGELYVPALLLAEPAAASAESAPRLTPRQSDVLTQMCLGLSNKGIARHLAMSEKTVKTHVTAIFKILGAANRTQAVNIARETLLAH